MDYFTKFKTMWDVVTGNEEAYRQDQQQQQQTRSSPRNNMTNNNTEKKSVQVSKDNDNIDVYTVQDSAETLAGVALRCNMSVNELRSLNNLGPFDSGQFSQGTKLHVRPRSASVEAESTPSPIRSRRSVSDLPLPDHKVVDEEHHEDYEFVEKHEIEENNRGEYSSPCKDKSDSEHVSPPQLFDSVRNNPTMLSKDQLSQLRQALPAHFRRKDWRLLYSTAEHGISLKTLYRSTEGQGPSIMVIKAKPSAIFGAFVSESWMPQPGFYGTGECFVFSFEPEFEYYLWSKKNNYFMISTDSYVGVGGGGHYAFCMDSDLKYGSTGSCDTFDSPPLCPEEDFKIVHIEVWGFKEDVPNKKQRRQVQWLNSPFTDTNHMRINSGSSTDLPAFLKRN